MSPTLLSEWLPIIKDYNHTYGLLSFFGMHSYVFRFFEKVGFVSLVPNLYNDSFKYLLLAENFKNIWGVCKMSEIAKKADASLLEKIQNGSVSINIEPIKSLASQLYEPINLIFEPIYLMIII